MNRSFAYPTITERAPVILTKALDTLHREWRDYLSESTIKLTDDQVKEAENEVKASIGQMSEMKYQMQTNKQLDDLKCSSAPDFDHWQSTIKSFVINGNYPTWFGAPWLLVECYMYRRIADILMQTKYFKTYDPFRSQKRQTLIDNLPQIRLISKLLMKQAESQIDDELKSWFELSLWGNRCDLSLKPDAQQFDNVFEDLQKLRQKILVNELDLVLKQVKSIRANSSDTATIDFVIDNAGFEFFTDLCLMDVLTRLLPNVQIRIHVKSYPWFVSDVTKPDLNWILDTLADDNESSELAKVAKRWQSNIDCHKWTICESYFWTYYNPFCEMSKMSTELYQQLTKSSLIVFKGDLNYRKLLGDLMWPHTVPFETALRGFMPAFLVALRTNKADLIAGFDDENSGIDLPKDWMVSGDFAIIQTAKPW